MNKQISVGSRPKAHPQSEESAIPQPGQGVAKGAPPPKAKMSLAEEFDSELHRRLYQALLVPENPTLEQRVNGLEYGMMDVLMALGEVHRGLEPLFENADKVSEAFDDTQRALSTMRSYFENINREPSKRRHARKQAGR